MLELYQELHVQTLQLLVPKVYSFAEKHIEGLLERLSYTIKKAKIEYDKDFGSKSQCISLIEKGCYIICKHCDLLYDKQMSTWNGFKDFHAVRKTIVHRYNMDVKNINIEYIRRNIEAAKKLLLSLEYATRRP